MISPFVTHRSKVLGDYGAAEFLRSVVLAMFNGNGHKAGLSSLRNLDHDHLTAFFDMTKSYARYGENDPAFMRLAQECRAWRG